MYQLYSPRCISSKHMAESLSFKIRGQDRTISLEILYNTGSESQQWVNTRLAISPVQTRNFLLTWGIGPRNSPGAGCLKFTFYTWQCNKTKNIITKTLHTEFCR